MSLKPLTRSLLTLAAVGVAIALVAALWRAYVLAPWTRDGRVSAHVVRIAPEVSGTVIDVAVVDNQRVSKGDVLYRIDPQRFALAVEQADAQVAASAETVRQKQDEARRRTGLDELVPKEDIQRSGRAVSIAQAEYRKALAALDVAKLDLERATLRSPVDGYVTQLRLRHGDYAVAGKPDISVLDAHSFWITGYFEETKLRHIAAGAPAQIRLMGFDPLLSGHVTSIGRGIADENGALDETGLPTVNPNFSWVRLAQRIPVRIELDHVPAGVLLAAGMTCSVEVAAPGPGSTPRGQLATWLHAWM
ncbi:biotin/lipoyl-binding protein [Burkholderia ubonensis]|uniref:Efflux transporter periplasmic adaptor subunit n=1 Tax=Burkholderia ubonensis subsp. mesacidophila TaxID=265293 RepID=A0A2A4FC07_9BURK|nr:HlyD family secretion protein [Burkholderia ubonensis]PCE30124.1 efflux transporter periplasmic adaptor subunit [Burkholderia ubonensis subsp. mesacidophila]